MATASAPSRKPGLAWLPTSSTPDRLRIQALATVLVIVAIGAVCWFLTDRLVGQTNEVATSTGEVLVATQQLTASLAEADTAAASVHLAGADGNREQLRLYEQASERSAVLLEQVARLVGDDARSHEALSDVAARSTRYVGLIESARLASVQNIAGADAMLAEASNLNRSAMLPEVQVVADRARDRFESQTGASWYIAAIIGLVVALALLVTAHTTLSRGFRRVLNVPLAIACLLMIFLVIMSARAFVGQSRALSNAQEDAEAILVSQQIQENAYRHRSLGTSSVLANQLDESDLESIEADVSGRLLPDARNATTSSREDAATDGIVERWDRYVVQSNRIQEAIASGDSAAAQSITQGPANATFNGFNTSVEAALLDNREQFLGELQKASNSLRWLRGIIFIGSLAAALLTWWGFSQRIGEYR